MAENSFYTDVCVIKFYTNGLKLLKKVQNVHFFFRSKASHGSGLGSGLEFSRSGLTKVRTRASIENLKNNAKLFFLVFYLSLSLSPERRMGWVVGVSLSDERLCFHDYDHWGVSVERDPRFPMLRRL